MRCILHIGTEKTGTTSLQAFLHRNRRILARHGHLYTKSAGLKNNRLLAVAAFNASKRDARTRMLGIESNDQLVQHQANIIESLQREISSAKAPTTIFSSEHIQSRLDTDEELARLKAILTELGFNEFSIVVYLRAPAEIANSLYSTAILSGATAARPRPPTYPHWSNLCHHQNTLTRYRRHFGEDSLIPRIYDPAELIGHSVIKDFAHAIELPISMDKLSIPSRKNETMGTTALALLRRMNSKAGMAGKKGERNTLRKTIISHIRQQCNDGPRYSMPHEIRRQYQEAYKESNEWVRREYFPNRTTLFTESEDPPAENAPEKTEELDQIAESIYQTCLKKASSPSHRFISLWQRIRSSS